MSGSGGRLRLLVVADTAHDWPEDSDGRYDLTPLVRQHRPDALISLGDYSTAHAPAIAQSGASFICGVYGNHCTDDYMPDHGIVDLIGDRALPARRRVLEFPGHRAISVLAVQGCVRYKSDPDDVLFTQAQYAAAIDRLPAAELVVTHCPPAGINDARDAAHQGIEALRTWVDRHRPRWLLHGHTYDNPPRSRHEGTEVIYTHGHAVVDLRL
ncbi:metallophosphoesterase family protein [Mycobacteroides chelonae]|uniref:metallophosphoesterase family protein n=1 Tax=Mycobacteroides chelonae TaxID=1774 RepID=UPI001F3CC9C2|nr:metallophosphoesterase [Mycobacteroides chelonae]